MSYKRAIFKAFVVVLILVIFSGCDFQMTMLPSQTAPSAIPPHTDKTQPSEETTAPTGSNVEVAILPEESFEMVNGVHATCENYNFTLYRGIDVKTQPVIEFYLITEKPLPEDASITIPGISASYRVDIHDRSPVSSEAFLSGSDKVLYAHLADPDLDFTTYLEEGRQIWAEYWRLYYLVYGEDGRQPGENYSPDHPYAEEYEKAEVAVSSYDNRYEEEYEVYRASQPMPEFHIYKVNLIFTSVMEKEQIKSVELIAGDMSRQILMANVWIAPKPKDLNTKGVSFSPNLEDPNTGFWLGNDIFTSVDSSSTFPFKSGVSGTTFYFVAKENMILEDLMPYGENTRICPEWVELAILGNSGTVVSAKWIPGTELLIRKGEQIAMRIYWSDPYTELFHYGACQSFLIDYSCGGEQCQMVCGSSYFRAPSDFMYPSYLQIVKELDLSRYFKEYFFASLVQ